MSTVDKHAAILQKLAEIQRRDYGASNPLRNDIVEFLQRVAQLAKDDPTDFGQYAVKEECVRVSIDRHTLLVDARGKLAEIEIRRVDSQAGSVSLGMIFATRGQLDSLITALEWARAHIDP